MAKKKKKRLPIEGKSFCPVGGMCVDCVSLYDNCSKLPFHQMFPVDVDEEWVYVSCKFRSKLMLNKLMDDFMSQYKVEPVEINHKNLLNASGLIHDELEEFVGEIFDNQGLGRPIPDDKINKENAVKEMIDIVYVTIQRLRRMGVDVDANLLEVHRSNMSKNVPLDKIDEELAIALKRYPEAYADDDVLRCGATQKVIKPTCYSAAVIKL